MVELSLLPNELLSMPLLSITQACVQLKLGQVIAYPTEAVFGLGCDPDCESAVLDILALKKRTIDKGLILIASEYSQLIPYIDESLFTLAQKQQALNSWPGPFTWIIPKNKSTPYYLSGKFDSIAVRVSDHPLVQKLCQQYGKALVSTSANLSGLPPCKDINAVKIQFGDTFAILAGEIGLQKNPSEIRDIKTGNIIRQG